MCRYTKSISEIGMSRLFVACLKMRLSKAGIECCTTYSYFAISNVKNMKSIAINDKYRERAYISFFRRITKYTLLISRVEKCVDLLNKERCGLFYVPLFRCELKKFCEPRSGKVTSNLTYRTAAYTISNNKKYWLCRQCYALLALEKRRDVLKCGNQKHPD